MSEHLRGGAKRIVIRRAMFNEVVEIQWIRLDGVRVSRAAHVSPEGYTRGTRSGDDGAPGPAVARAGTHMSVYVDNMQAHYGRMVMCHMIADSTDELLAMADQIGVNRRWIQHAGTPYEHFDICLSAKREAINRGAITITKRELSTKIKQRVTPGSRPAVARKGLRMTETEWLDRYAARLKEQAKLTDIQARECARAESFAVLSEGYEDDPEGAADEEMSCWED